MSIETANRLLEFRKANGYSQEELAEKIGVSRQAISKWERSESSPDTDNLIALAKLYGVTLDELLGVSINSKAPEKADSAQSDPQADTAEKNTAPQDDTAEEQTVLNGQSIDRGNDWKSFYESDMKKIKQTVKTSGMPLNHALLPIVIIIVYLILGFTMPRGWATGWILFLLIPIVETGFAAFKTKNPSVFAYPVLATAIFLTIGMVFYIWHPTWIIFLTIPIYYLLCASLKHAKRFKEEERQYIENSEEKGTYYTPAGAEASNERKGSNASKIIIAVVCCITIIAVVAAVCVFGFWRHSMLNNIVSGIGDFASNIGSAYSSEYNYENSAAYSAGSGEIPAKGITGISVNWFSGTVDIEYYDGDTIAFSEPEQSDSDYALHYLAVGSELKIEFCRSGIAWPVKPSKPLKIYIPRDLALFETEVETVSADITVNGIKTNKLSIETVSGNALVNGEFQELSIETGSGKSDITAMNEPLKIDLDAVSGAFKLGLDPDIRGFYIKSETISGSVKSEDFDLKLLGKGRYIYNDSGTMIEFDAVSGSLEIVKNMQ